MSNVMKKPFSEGEIKTPDKAHSSSVKLNNVTLSKAVLQPGWKWSTCIKPIVGTETCQAGHVGVIAQGTMHVKHDDGTEMEFTEGDTYFLAPGHDAWVVGDKEVIGYEFITDDKDFGPWKKG